MKRYFSGVIWWLTFVGGSLADLLGGVDQLLQSLFFFMIADYISGIFQAGYHKALNSKIGFQGLVKKSLTLLMIMISVELEQLLGQTLPFREMTIMFYLANEGLSLLENIGSVIPLPKKIRQYFSQLKDKADE